MRVGTDLVLLQIDAEATRVVHLPEAGTLVIGRGEGAGIRLEHAAVSRCHAKVTVEAGEALLSDLGSHNGTYVNGERIAGVRRLLAGDVISICRHTLVFHPVARPVLTAADLRARLEEELDRAQHADRPLSVASIHLVSADDRVTQALRSALRRIDVVGWDTGDDLCVLMLETDALRAGGECARLLESLRTIAPGVRVGFATFPLDGPDADALLERARSAAARAEPGTWAAHPRTTGHLTIRGVAAVVADPAMTRLYALVRQLAAARLPVLVCGESGVGKALAAAALHEWSPRAAGPFQVVDCAALPAEPFDDVRGGGTVFLDEVAELGPELQAKVLSVLDEDVRVVAATSRNLAAEVRAGRFSQDLFHRLSGGQLWIPPLRERRVELPILARALLTEATARLGRGPLELSADALEEMMRYGWPGNVRELRNLADYLAATVPGEAVEAGPVRDWLRGAEPAFHPLDEEVRALERRRMIEALRASRGNQTRAAELIHMPRRTFVTKLKVLEIGPQTWRE